MFFEHQLKAECVKPITNKPFPSFVKKLYEFPSLANEMLQVPLVDAPVAAPQSPGLLSEDGQGSVKDDLVLRNDPPLRRSDEALAVAIKASATTSTVSRASIVWMCKLIQLLSENNKRMVEGANRIRTAAAFSPDATLDALTSSPAAMASSTMA